MRSDQLTGDQVETIAAKVRPSLRYARELQKRMEAEKFPPEDPLRLATIAAGDALQDLLTELHYLSVDPGSAGKIPKTKEAR